MPIVIGPILRRGCGYGFDTWSAAGSLKPGYPYRRIEDAQYAWKAAIKEHSSLAVVCETHDEFIAKSSGCSAVAA